MRARGWCSEALLPGRRGLPSRAAWPRCPWPWRCRRWTCRPLCALVVTSNAVISLSLPSLAFLDCRSLPEVTGLDAGASITNTITTACATSSVVCVVPAFDRETRCLVRGLDTQHANGGAARLLASRQHTKRAEQQAARRDRKAAGVVLSEAAMAHTASAAPVEPATEPGQRETLSLFLSQQDMRALGCTREERGGRRR